LPQALCSTLRATQASRESQLLPIAIIAGNGLRCRRHRFMSRLFLSYRNNDTGPYAGRLADRLKQLQFEAVFQDREAIAVGEDFADAIRDEIARCAAVLVLIGGAWVDARDDSGRRRLDDPKDWVRREVSIALALPLLVVPVLFDSARPPTASQLPSDVAALANKNAYHFDGRYFDRDADDLGRRVENALAKAHAGSEVRTASPAAGLLRQLQIIWIALSVVTLGTSVAPFVVPALPHLFWIFPATMTLTAFMWWNYCLAAALPAVGARG
jgi:hypothetical protein